VAGVDTRDKRFSMLGLAQSYGAPYVLPNPDGTFNEEADRIQLLYLYRGILPSGAVEAEGDRPRYRWTR